MAEISASLVKELREMTGLPMMECKKALTEAGGDLKKDEELLRIRSGAKASKAASRIAAEGIIGSFLSADAQLGALVELNCETDFVAKNDQFIELANQVADFVVAQDSDDLATVAAAEIEPGKSLQSYIEGKSAIIGEKLEFRRIAKFDGAFVASYLHKSDPDLPPTMGVLVELDKKDEEVGKDLAQQIAALAPQYISKDDVPAEVVANERRIAEETTREEGKPEQAIPKIVEGRLNGYFKDVTLLGQPFVKENKKTVQKVVDEAGVTVKRFVRFKVGQA